MASRILGDCPLPPRRRGWHLEDAHAAEADVAERHVEGLLQVGPEELVHGQTPAARSFGGARPL